MQYVVLAGEVWPANTLEEIEAIEVQLDLLDLDRADVWVGDPDCPDSHRKGSVILAASGSA